MREVWREGKVKKKKSKINEKNTDFLISLLFRIFKKSKFIVLESRLVVTRGEGG